MRLLTNIQKGYAAIETKAIPKCQNQAFILVMKIIKTARKTAVFVADIVPPFFYSQRFEGPGVAADPAMRWPSVAVSEPIRYELYVLDLKRDKKKKTEISDEKKPKEERFILCRQCEHKITKPDYRFIFQGAFDHTFLNPAGQVFHIGCFSRADGCVALGESSLEWTWFQGYHWRVVVCGQCLTHLGWHYAADQAPAFFGLILDALV